MPIPDSSSFRLVFRGIHRVAPIFVHQIRGLLHFTLDIHRAYASDLVRLEPLPQDQVPP